MKQLVPHFVLALVALGDIRELDVEAGLLRVYEVRRITALLSAVTGEFIGVTGIRIGRVLFGVSYEYGEVGLAVSVIYIWVESVSMQGALT